MYVRNVIECPNFLWKINKDIHDVVRECKNFSQKWKLYKKLLKKWKNKDVCSYKILSEKRNLIFLSKMAKQTRCRISKLKNE